MSTVKSIYDDGRITLVNVISDTDTATFGTCELCMSTGELTTETMVFSDGTHVETGYWSWGDYIVEYYIDNYGRLNQYFLDNPIYDSDKIEEHIYEYCNL